MPICIAKDGIFWPAFIGMSVSNLTQQETQLSRTNRATRLEVSQGHQTWYHVIY